MELDIEAAIGVDLATKGDLMSMMEKLEERYRENIFAAFSGITNASGAVNFRVYDIPDGMQFYPSRYMIWSDAHNPSTGGCFESTTAWGGIYHGQPSPVNLADYFPPPSGGLAEGAAPNILPYYKEFNKHDAPEFQSPDNVAFALVNGPPTTNITCIMYGWLEEIREGKRFPRRSRMRNSRLGLRRSRRPVVAGYTEDATLG
jgi:hypothetical protein